MSLNISLFVCYWLQHERNYFNSIVVSFVFWGYLIETKSWYEGGMLRDVGYSSWKLIVAMKTGTLMHISQADCHYFSSISKWKVPTWHPDCKTRIKARCNKRSRCCGRLALILSQPHLTTCCRNSWLGLEAHTPYQNSNDDAFMVNSIVVTWTEASYPSAWISQFNLEHSEMCPADASDVLQSSVRKLPNK
jgi:hypothetical protein